MSRFNTGNPLDSDRLEDLSDNAKNMDLAVNSGADTFKDRLGKSRLTWAGMENQFESDQSEREVKFNADQSFREAVFSDFLQASGYQDLGEYAPGIEITAHNQYVTFGGQPYLLKSSIPVPYTTSGEWTGDDFKLIGDDSLRQDLANPDKGAAMVWYGGSNVHDALDDIIQVTSNAPSFSLKTNHREILLWIDEIAPQDIATAVAVNGITRIHPQSLSYYAENDWLSVGYSGKNSEGEESGAIIVVYNKTTQERVGWFIAGTSHCEGHHFYEWDGSLYIAVPEEHYTNVIGVYEVPSTMDGATLVASRTFEAPFKTTAVAGTSTELIVPFTGTKRGAHIFSIAEVMSGDPVEPIKTCLFDLKAVHNHKSSYNQSIAYKGDEFVIGSGSPYHGGTDYANGYVRLNSDGALVDYALYTSSSTVQCLSEKVDPLTSSVENEGICFDRDGNILSLAVTNRGLVVFNETSFAGDFSAGLDRVNIEGDPNVSDSGKLRSIKIRQTCPYTSITLNSLEDVIEHRKRLGVHRLVYYKTAGLLSFEVVHNVPSLEYGLSPILIIEVERLTSVTDYVRIIQRASNGDNTWVGVYYEGFRGSLVGVRGNMLGGPAGRLVTTQGIDRNAIYLSILGINDATGATSTNTRFNITDSHVYGTGDGTQALGHPTVRWGQIYSSTGTINTSDARGKQQVRGLTGAEKEVAKELKTLLCAFKWNDAVHIKGENARWHFGVLAQEVIGAFAKHGLDAFNYGMICYDEWDDTFDPDNNLVAEAGNRYGVRYEQLLAFIISAL